MEGIAVMILYLVIGFFKNRKDKMKRKKIKEDPDWDSEEKPEPDIGINNILTKRQGSKNTMNLVHATINALYNLKDAVTIANKRGITLKKVFN